MNVIVFLATGFEETEAIATIDVLRRAGINATTVSISGDYDVTSTHNVTI
ncbi:MAG: DJ-1/PfpI family protein, partial [Dysgonamonadaceae bacterium]